MKNSRVNADSVDRENGGERERERDSRICQR